MSVTRIIAKACWICGNPIVDDSDERYEAWLMVMGQVPAHDACANRATKEREFKEEKPSS